MFWSDTNYMYYYYSTMIALLLCYNIYVTLIFALLLYYNIYITLILVSLLYYNICATSYILLSFLLLTFLRYSVKGHWGTLECPLYFLASLISSIWYTSLSTGSSFFIFMSNYY